MRKEIEKILMALHTIPTKTEGNTPMERISNARHKICSLFIEELEKIRETRVITGGGIEPISRYSIDNLIDNLKRE